MKMNLDKDKLRALIQLEIQHLKLLGWNLPRRLQVHMLTHFWYMDYLDEVTSYLPKEKRVLDIGCGGGYFANLLKIAGYDIVAGDIVGSETPSGEFWHLQRSKVKQQPDYIRFDGRAIPFKDKSFDAVITIAVLEHVQSDERKLLKEILRVLRPGGRFSIYELPRKLSYEYLINRIGLSTAHERFYNKDIKDMLIELGFSVMAIETYWYVPRRIVGLVKARRAYLLAKHLRPLSFLASFLKIVCTV